MRLYCRCLPEYFALLGVEKQHEFRQIECIAVENSETREIRQFLVRNIIRLDEGRAQAVKENYPCVPWDAKLPVFAIKLGDEIKIEPAARVEAERGVLEKRDDGGGKFEFFNQKKEDK